MSGRRLETGGLWLDRSRPIAFTFDDHEITGYAGDTVASALLAAGEMAGFVSPIVARPRGVFSAGVEEPHAFVEISAPWFEAIRPATMVPAIDGMVVASIGPITSGDRIEVRIQGLAPLINTVK